MRQKRNVPKLVVRREIEAGAKELFDAWLDASSLGEWMRPEMFTRCRTRIDPREGGAFEIIMENDEESCVHTGVYRLIDRPRKLVFTWASQATGQKETLVTVEFHPHRGRTEVVVTHEQLPDKQAVRSHGDGWTQILHLLALKFGAPHTS